MQTNDVKFENSHHLYSKFIGIALAAMMLSACSGNPNKAAIDTESGSFDICASPRPQVCTREYRPVCGHIDNGLRCATEPCNILSHKTYSNHCTACADARVIGAEQGSCESFGK